MGLNPKPCEVYPQSKNVLFRLFVLGLYRFGKFFMYTADSESDYNFSKIIIKIQIGSLEDICSLPMLLFQTSCNKMSKINLLAILSVWTRNVYSQYHFPFPGPIFFSVT